MQHKNPRTARKKSRTKAIESLEQRAMLAGNGLAATYFDGPNFSGASVSRVDARVDAKWDKKSPDSRIAPDTFSARWQGQVEPRHSQTYTFSTSSDDGVRLWVNGQLLIHEWNNHPPTEHRGTINLQAGKRYDIKLEYYENYGGSTAQLYWASANQKREIIPQSQLYSGATPVTPPSSTPTPTPQPPPAPVAGSLRVSPNGRYLLKADGSPFFYLADTAWRAPAKLNPAEIDFYLKTRAAQGFNVVQMVLIDESYSARNYAGQAPLHNNNPATPNDAFFDHVDYIVSKAAAYGIHLALMPTWGRNVADAGRRIFNTSSAYAYGNFLGKRYKHADNIIWLNGGDWAVNDSTTASIWRSLAQGISDGDKGVHLITWHPRGGQSAGQYFQGESWLDFNMIQSGHVRDSAVWDFVSREYTRGPVKPVIEGEPNYEGIPVNAVHGSLSGAKFDAYDVRKKAYWAVFAGAAGTAYGSNEVFQFHEGGGGIMAASTPWQHAVYSAGATQMQHLRKLMESRPFQSRIPDQSLLSSSAFGGTDHIQATRDVAGSYAFIYSASGKSFGVNMSHLVGERISAAWYDPRTGKLSSAGTYGNGGTRTFAPPSSGYGNDWVLVLDAA